VTIRFAEFVVERGTLAWLHRGDRARAAARLLPLLLGTALPPTASTQTLDDQIRDEVRRYVRTVNAGDPAALAALYLDSPAVGSLGNGNVATGRRDVAALLDDVYRTVDSIRMSVDSVTVLPLGPDAALAYFRYRWGVFGAAPRWEAGAMTLVFRRANGRWWVAHDHTSTLPGDQPAALPAPADSVARAIPCGRPRRVSSRASPTATPSSAGGSVASAGPHPLSPSPPCGEGGLSGTRL
jgi:uncharacterized protein (TIGR02246 family)